MDATQPTPIMCITGQSDTHLTDIQNHRLHSAIISDFLALQSAAKKAGFDLTIASSFRDFERQSIIWNNKFLGIRPVFNKQQEVVDLTKLSDIDKCIAIMLYSALPGASRHHLGTDLDVFDKAAVSDDYKLQLTPDEYQLGGPFSPLSNWLDANLVKYGFYRPYQHDLGGVAPELWHISHIKQSQLLVNRLDEHAFFDCIKNSELQGKQAILDNLPAIYTRFVTNVGPP
ncbi:M15 family metallopeptidase [Pseudoalteromonas sp. SG45-5]|uniref:M15 family metallopeptidase n=1 Tax=unclassified Pseudoalteromonas TaxID=194690 RepID=UPI0015FE512A|nr:MULTISPECIES: M15 family metallopeptidase [unclassified Pseudoalteromonas]MBB1386281.1 M15 family metallopeptidase [Pseudoalteromonas sp. SG45-5]MBB1394348.1 M15 family metallopeptidase [Pseudoalteromonas sp. SG44-4]MBB1447658.1 M15 family metallopeptidase [Pseudoalteromonas sp. SG41-6]